MEVSLVLPYDRYKKANNIPDVDSWEMYQPDSTESYEKVVESVEKYSKIQCNKKSSNSNFPEKIKGYPVNKRGYIVTKTTDYKTTGNQQINYLNLVEDAKIIAEKLNVKWTDLYISLNVYKAPFYVSQIYIMIHADKLNGKKIPVTWDAFRPETTNSFRELKNCVEKYKKHNREFSEKDFPYLMNDYPTTDKDMVVIEKVYFFDCCEAQLLDFQQNIESCNRLSYLTLGGIKLVDSDITIGIFPKEFIKD